MTIQDEATIVAYIEMDSFVCWYTYTHTYIYTTCSILVNCAAYCVTEHYTMYTLYYVQCTVDSVHCTVYTRRQFVYNDICVERYGEMLKRCWEHRYYHMII